MSGRDDRAKSPRDGGLFSRREEPPKTGNKKLSAAARNPFGTSNKK